MKNSASRASIALLPFVFVFLFSGAAQAQGLDARFEEIVDRYLAEFHGAGDGPSMRNDGSAAYYEDRLDVAREPTQGELVPPDLDANEGVYSARRDFALHAESFAREGDFIVRGFTGREENDHVCHLMAMKPLALDPLIARWAQPLPAISGTN